MLSSYRLRKNRCGGQMLLSLSQSTLPFAKPASVSSHSWHTLSSRATIQSPVQPCIWLKARGLWGPWCRGLFSSNEALLELVHERLPHELKRQERCTAHPAACSSGTGENCREPPSWPLVLLPGEMSRPLSPWPWLFSPGALPLAILGHI